jgi:hypothetical protein
MGKRLWLLWLLWCCAGVLVCWRSLWCVSSM